MRKFIEKKDWPLITIIILSIVSIYLYAALDSERKQHKKFREQSPMEFLAMKYCMTLQYTEETWATNFEKCINDAQNDPVSTMNQYLSNK